jgi:hypothetical protein
MVALFSLSQLADDIMEQVAIFILIIVIAETVAFASAALWLRRNNKRRLEQRKGRTS